MKTRTVRVTAVSPGALRVYTIPISEVELIVQTRQHDNEDYSVVTQLSPARCLEEQWVANSSCVLISM